VRVVAAFFLALFACGASLLVFQALATNATTVSYLTLAGVVLLLLIGIGAILRAGGALRALVAPIDDLLETTGRLAAGDYTARADPRGLPELRRLAASINAMAERLERTAAERRGFFASVTHELRTPLTILRGELEGMLDGINPPDQRRLASLLEETEHLSSIVEDLRTLSLADSGALDLRLEPTELADFVHEVGAAFAGEAERAGVDIEIRTAEGAPAADVDPRRLREVLANLIVNALHASPPGTTLTLGYTQAGSKHTLTVTDQGPGIPPDALPTIFDRFTKSAESEGSGLGLAIARELVEAHGGSIEASSKVGAGTTIRVALPAAS
jgi:two-component system sensor histidine kinase BaeS